MIVLCVTGSVAAVETIKLAREFRRQGFEVQPFLSENGKNIIHPNALEFACGKGVITHITGMIEHIKYADVDLILVAPATANIISKFRYKIADDHISSLLIVAQGHDTPILFVPSMHETMYKTISENIKELKSEGIHFFEPKLNEGHAKFPNKHDIVLESLKLTSNRELNGKNILISIGRTIEHIDPIRVISNESTGKMGLEIIKEGYKQGANLTVISGKVDIEFPKMIDVIKVDNSEQMSEEIKKQLKTNDAFISVAAVSDFIPKSYDKKISSKNSISVEFMPAEKIIEKVKDISPTVFLVGFKAEHNLSDEELINKGRKQINKSKSDLVVVNDTGRVSNSGLDRSYAILVNENSHENIGFISKKDLAHKIFNELSKKI
ncbi:MAG: bifunctional phosphopantothenoylcysteine decarboxylase/phosphopantothenate--cysteine ligase CoaBC [Methanobrevibacter sp.]|jgi:phosphopantothenoylcysteine decarboxylase/phosphopantothenate--cysteine ligase|nr:bifunctional phosphopantothenoylcysteine decarboxylase/phosphopantothenate--cysteine ligase CoaBC [Candidatus Methanovirga basalitermitum]